MFVRICIIYLSFFFCNCFITLLVILYFKSIISELFKIKFNFSHGLGFILLWLISAFQTDNGALFLGSLIGKTKFSPIISPNKTWEGVSGGILLRLLLKTYFKKFLLKMNNKIFN